MKRLSLGVFIGVMSLAALGISKPQPDIYYFSHFEGIDLDFLRTHYTEIKNNRPIRVEARYLAYKWRSPFEYKEQLNLVGFNLSSFNILQFTLKEKDDFHYVFPLLLFPTRAGDLQELQGLTAGDKIVIYGRFYNLRDSEYAITVDVMETVRKGGHDRSVLLDTRLAPTPVPMPSATPTPGPGLWNRLKKMMNSTPTPTGTTTPEAK